MRSLNELLKRFRKVCIDYYTLEEEPIIVNDYETMSDDELIRKALCCAIVDYREEIRKDQPTYEETI